MAWVFAMVLGCRSGAELVRHERGRRTPDGPRPRTYVDISLSASTEEEQSRQIPPHELIF